MAKRWMGRWALVAAGAALVVGGCRGGVAVRLCSQSGVAEVCLIEEGAAYRVTGHGLQPGTEVHLTQEGAPGRVFGGRADQDGTIPGPAVNLGVIKGPDPQQVEIRGTTATGEQAEFNFQIPAA